MIVDPIFYLIAVPGVVLAGVGKGGFGTGVGFLVVPLMSLVIPPLLAAAIFLPLLCVMDLFGVWAYRRHWDRENLIVILQGGLAGIGLAWATASYVSDNGVRIIIGLVAVAFALDHWFGSRLRQGATGVNRPKGWFWSAVSGFTSFVAHAGGPPISIYMVPQKLDKTTFVGTLTLFFITINYAKILPYWLLGQFDGQALPTALVLMPLAPLGMVLGIWLHKRLSPAVFYEVIYGVVLCIGLKLLWDGAGIGRL